MRLGHPRLTPQFFPDRPTCYFYRRPRPILLGDRPALRDADFETSLLYRGTMTLMLELAVNHLGYRNIVLLGIDLNTYEHFYADHPEMKDAWARSARHYDNEKKVFPLQIPKEGKPVPLEGYLYAVRDYLARRRGVRMWTGLADSMLCPAFPAYFG
jgi:hypothetical protein